jgi:Bacteriophage tail sheath protein
MPFYATPGVYVEEVPSGTHPIAAVGTSTAAFLGTAPDPRARLGDAVAINTWSDFLRIYVGEGASVEEPNVLAAAVFGFFDNGGGRCYVVNMAPGDPLAGAGRQRNGLRLLEPIDEIAIVAAPGRNDPASWAALISHCENLEDRVCILDTVSRVDDVEQLTRVKEETPGPDDDQPPSPGPSRGKGSSSSSSSGGEAAPTDAGGGAADARAGGDDEAARPPTSNYAATYFPWIIVQHPLTGQLVAVPPSGHMAGIWARTDTTRGVHKAPANEGVHGAVGLEQALTREEQAVINPAGVNAIRSFPGAGILVWGARTLDEEASPFRYLNVRRLFNMLKESIGDNTRWIVFEPNDYMLWRSIVRDVSAFLTLVWRDGALFGRTPQEAFFVKCDAEVNTEEERDAGRVVCLIGVAPVKPAEFVVFKLSQTAGGAEIETIGG